MPFLSGTPFQIGAATPFNPDLPLEGRAKMTKEFLMKRLFSSLLFCGLLLTPCAAPDAFAAEARGKAPAEAAVQKKESGFRGNPASKVYQNAGCQYFNSKGATKEFATPQEAVKAGFRPCKICNG